MALYKVEICGVNTTKLPLLKNSEKEELFERILKGDKEAREEYIKGNLRLVLSIIQRFANNGKLPDGKDWLWGKMGLALVVLSSCSVKL